MVARSREVPADVPEVAATWDPIGSVHPWPSNPRTHSDQHIADIRREIERDAWGAVIVVQASTRRIIAGHGRLLAAKAMGLERVPVREVEVDDDQAARMALADNQLTHAGAWDDDALAEVLRDLTAREIDLSGLGWSDDELAALLADVCVTSNDQFSGLPTGTPEHRQMTFTLTHAQHAAVEAAVTKARRLDPADEENSNGRALARVCEAFLG